MNLTRRQVVAGTAVGGGLLVALAVVPRHFPLPTEPGPGEVTFDAWLRIGRDGTITLSVPQLEMGQGVLTVLAQIAAVELGAILGKVAPEGRTHLRGYARDIGLAFQIADDLLDHEGDEAAAGKALRKDAEAGKETFVSLLGPERAREQASFLVEQAINHLANHGSEADLLRALARYIIERDH